MLRPEYIDSARMDGASETAVIWRIVFPLLRPATASVLIFLGVWIWNDFLSPLIILGPSQGTTITTGIYRAIGREEAAIRANPRDGDDASDADELLIRRDDHVFQVDARP